MEKMFEIPNKVAIVTGASRGLGKAMAIGLAKAGANIVATDVLDTSDTVKEIEKLGRQKGFLKKGDQVDEDRTARFIIKDWQEGKIKI